MICHRSFLAPLPSPAPLYCSWYENSKGLFNTPPCYTIYVMGLVLKWVKSKGALPWLEGMARARSEMIYDLMQEGGEWGYYTCPVNSMCRSRVNVPFSLPTPALELEFLHGAGARGLVDLAGHRAVGGCRASMYTGMPLEGVRALRDYMIDFRDEHPWP